MSNPIQSIDVYLQNQAELIASQNQIIEKHAKEKQLLNAKIAAQEQIIAKYRDEESRLAPQSKRPWREVARYGVGNPSPSPWEGIGFNLGLGCLMVAVVVGCIIMIDACSIDPKRKATPAWHNRQEPTSTPESSGPYTGRSSDYSTESRPPSNDDFYRNPYGRKK
jgi:hypothetical protein